MDLQKVALLGFFLVANTALILSVECVKGGSSTVANFAPTLIECGTKYGVNPKDVAAARKTRILNGIEPCYFSCFMKKIGFMDDKGFFVPEKAREITKLFIQSDADLVQLDHAIETCKAVNKGADYGEQGCERAKMLAGCIFENKGFDALP